MEIQVKIENGQHPNDSVFTNPNSAGNNKIKIGTCEFDLTTTPETVEEWISHIRKIMSDFGQVPWRFSALVTG